MGFASPMLRAALLTGLICATAGSAWSQTLGAIKARGQIVCGVSQGILGFSVQSAGTWSGFDVDFCRALSAAIFDDPAKVRFVPLSPESRFTALKAGDVDVLARNSTWTMSREAELGLLFAAVTFYDGQGFLIPRARNVSAATDLNDSAVCTQAGTTTEANLADYFEANGMKYKLVLAPDADAMAAKYQAGECNVITADASQLHAIRATFKAPAEHVILADVISKEPLGPVVRQGDVQWFNIVKWVAFALINAEELGVNSQTLEDAKKSKKPDVERLVGSDGNLGEQIGLTKDWVVRVVGKVGDYSEIYERNVGVKSRLGIPRGINQLWNRGGILYAPPLK